MSFARAARHSRVGVFGPRLHTSSGRLDVTRRRISSRLDFLHPQVGVHATHSSRSLGRVARARGRDRRAKLARVKRASKSAIDIPFEKYTLPNGLTVVLSEDHATPTVAVEVIYHVGSKNEMPGHTGFAHMFEHVMFTGSGHVPYGTHDKFTEGVGGSNNGKTNNDWTRY